MDLTREITFDAVAEVVDSESDVVVGMRRLLDHCARQQPSPVWERISLLDFAADADAVRRWLEDLLATEPPSDDIAAFWFGLFESAEPEVESEDEPSPVARLYIAGSEVYDPDDPMAEWACSPEYFPKGRYADSAVLQSLSQILASADDEAFSLGTYVLPLGYAGLTVMDAARRIATETWLGARDSRALAVGFDSGDYLTLPAIRR